MGDDELKRPWQEMPSAAVELLDEDGRLAYEMGQIAQRIAQDKLPGGVQLDFSPGSIQVLEQLLTVLYDNFPRGWWAKLRRKQYSEERIWHLSVPPGAYLGETIRRTIGGRWTCRVKAYPDEAQYMVLSGGSIIAPISKVFKRLADGPADDVNAYYYMIRTLDEQARADTLAATLTLGDAQRSQRPMA